MLLPRPQKTIRNFASRLVGLPLRFVDDGARHTADGTVDTSLSGCRLSNFQDCDLGAPLSGLPFPLPTWPAHHVARYSAEVRLSSDVVHTRRCIRIDH